MTKSSDFISRRDTNDIKNPLISINSVNHREKTVHLKGKSDSRENLLEAIMSNYGKSYYTQFPWPKTEILDKFLKNYPNLKPLCLDYGFITHLPQFFEMIKKIDISNMNYKEVRQTLKEHLGTKTVYRGMGLTEEQLDIIMNKTGIESKFLLHMRNYRDIVGDYIEKYFLSKTCTELFKNQINFNKSQVSPLISITEHKDITIAVALKYKKPGTQIYLFELEIPEIDRIYYTDHTIPLPEKSKSNGKPIGITKVDGKYEKYYDLIGIESFVINKINKSEIKSFEKINVDKAIYFIQM